MSWQQIIVIVFLVADLIFGLVKHGDRKIGRYSFWWALFWDGVAALILYSGGFWK